MAKALKSNFKENKAPDTKLHLSHGAYEIETILVKDLSETENDLIIVKNTGRCDKSGTATINDEIIYYHLADYNDPTWLCDLLRGQEGTIPAKHSAGSIVTIHGKPRHGNPAVSDSIIAMQETIIELLNRVDKLEKKVR